MPARRDLESILIIGSGPIVIGQACEFDYSGTQAIKALKQEGYRIILVNSNPATIMTDPELADATYLEPLTVEVLERILERERPDALLPTVGGQTALNLACQLHDRGILERYGVTLLGARREAVELAEDRLRFKQTMEAAGVPTPPAGYVQSVEAAEALVDRLGLPLIIRPSFTLGGAGAGIARTLEALRAQVAHGLACSPVGKVLVERSVQGWKEFELEVMRDHKDQVVIICSIENVDPMGVHTGDSITVAPAQTLTDREYQRMRDMALKVIRAIGVETGGANIQFAVNPRDGELVVIEMNPRVSRSSALASKATGFPIAKIAALLAVGYSLDELPNDITLKTPASFEPTLDYVVVKLPRWDLEKFPNTDTTLGASMKSVGEVMAIGRTFQESFQKALRSLETGLTGFEALPAAEDGTVAQRSEDSVEALLEALAVPNPARLQQLATALRAGVSVEALQSRTDIDRWFLHQLQQLATLGKALEASGPHHTTSEQLHQALQAGFSDRQLARLWATTEAHVRRLRARRSLQPVFKRVDTCAAEFEAQTPYLYSCWDEECEAAPTQRRKILILGSGPNRIGQGIEFDYCCCHAAFALKALDIEALLINCNPETVSTDYDTADRLYFEPLTLQDVLEVIRREQPEGVIVQLGGQTPLKLCLPLHRLGVRILGTAPESIDLAEDRERFGQLLVGLGIPQPLGGVARSQAEAQEVAERLGFPLLLRPSYVLGGKAMTVVHGLDELKRTLETAVRASEDRPVLIDRFLEQALELDIDAVADGKTCVIAGILEHIEAAGVHSGDSAAVLPPQTVPERHLTTIRGYTQALARALGVRGLMNLQVAIQSETVYVLEVNPRASRTVPFVSKATGVAWAQVAARVLAGESLAEQGLTESPAVQGVWVKEAVLPFDRFPEEDSLLGPEMKSTGEVMGVAEHFGAAYAKALLAAGERLPRGGSVLVLIDLAQVHVCLPLLHTLLQLGYALEAPSELKRLLTRLGVKVAEFPEDDPHSEEGSTLLHRLRRQGITLAVCTGNTRQGGLEPRHVRRATAELGIPCLTELSGAWALLEGLRAEEASVFAVESLQARYQRHAKLWN